MNDIVQLFTESNIVYGSVNIYSYLTTGADIEFEVIPDTCLVRPGDTIRIDINSVSLVCYVREIYMAKDIVQIKASVVSHKVLVPIHPDNPEIEEIGRKILDAVGQSSESRNIHGRR